MAFLLAIPAIALPAILVIGTIRGRVRPTCCAVVPLSDDTPRPESA